MGPGEASGPQAPAHSELTLRVLSAIVLGAFVLGLTWWGGWPFAVFWLLAGLAILYEWLRMVDAKPFAPLAVALGIALVVAAGLLFVGSASVWLLVPTGIGLAASLGLGRTRHDRLWAFAGALCAAVLVLVPPAIRAPAEWGLFGPNLGRDILFLLYGIVWATDIGAYFVGRAVGGPKLMPKVSPKKTWSGALGGLAAAVLTNVVLLKVSGASLSARVLFAAAALSVVSQIGDLMESALKRHFGAKDSSHLIPGHGGVMDRLDGFFAVCAILLAWFFVESAAR